MMLLIVTLLILSASIILSLHAAAWLTAAELMEDDHDHD